MDVLYGHRLIELKKMLCLQRYLIPQAEKLAGVNTEMVSVSDQALQNLIKSYCRESGVRNLQKYIEKVK